MWLPRCGTNAFHHPDPSPIIQKFGPSAPLTLTEVLDECDVDERSHEESSSRIRAVAEILAPRAQSWTRDATYLHSSRPMSVATAENSDQHREEGPNRNNGPKTSKSRRRLHDVHRPTPTAQPPVRFFHSFVNPTEILSRCSTLPPVACSSTVSPQHFVHSWRHPIQEPRDSPRFHGLPFGPNQKPPCRQRVSTVRQIFIR